MTDSELARAIAQHIPRNRRRRGIITADQLALALVVRGGPKTVGDIAKALGVPSATATAYVSRGLEDGRVFAFRMGARRFIGATPVGKVELRSARRFDRRAAQEG